MFFIPLDPVNLFANSVDTKQSYLAFLSRCWAFITKWHKGHIWGLGGKAKTCPRGGRAGMSSLPSQECPYSWICCQVSNQNTHLNFVSECRCPSMHKAETNLHPVCSLIHLSFVLFSLCFVIWVLSQLNSIKSCRFYLPSWWSCSYLLGLSWETIFPLNKEHKEHSHFATTTFNSVKKNTFIPQLSFFVKIQSLA